MQPNTKFDRFVKKLGKSLAAAALTETLNYLNEPEAPAPKRVRKAKAKKREVKS